MTKTKVKLYGRLAHDVDIEELRDQVTRARDMLDHMEQLLANNLNHEEALDELRWFWDRSKVLLNMSMLRPIFTSHLIGRLLEDGVSFVAMANKIGTTKQKMYQMYYGGVGGRQTAVPRQRRKTPA